MQIVSVENNLQETSNRVSWKNKKKYFTMWSAKKSTQGAKR